MWSDASAQHISANITAALVLASMALVGPPPFCRRMIEEGADIVSLRGAPLKDIAALREVGLTCRTGRATICFHAPDGAQGGAQRAPRESAVACSTRAACSRSMARRISRSRGSPAPSGSSVTTASTGTP